jgi:hypothetical protein
MKLINKLSILKYVREQKEDKKQSNLAIAPNSTFVYSGGSNVLATWRKAGFIPPSEYREDFLFGVNKKAKDNL